MFSFFDQIWSFIASGFQFLYNTISSLVIAVGVVLGSVNLPQQLAHYMPAVLGSGILVTVAIYVIRFLLLK